MSVPINLPTRTAGLLAAAAMLLAACSAAGTPAPSAPASGAAGGQADVVDVGQSSTLGAYLTADGGRTLYVFKKDSGGTSACTGQCAASWPPFTVAAASTAQAGTGVTGTLATITRADGSTQVTYDGAPLYFYSGDTKAGDTTGQGLNGVWFVETPSGTTGAAASPSPASGGYGGYGGGSGSPSAAASSAAASTAAGPAASIVDYGFQPTSLTVKVGTTVTWTNTGGVPHTVTADAGSFSSGDIAPGSTFRYTFATAGTFAYHCAIHGSMTATVVVTP